MYYYGDPEISPEDALLILNHRLSESDVARDIWTAIQESKKALEYRIIKTAIPFHSDMTGANRKCPRCENTFTYHLDKSINFCPYCGQSISLEKETLNE